jgi:hypothetical protein
MVRRIHVEVAGGRNLLEARPGLEVFEAGLRALGIADGSVWVDAL